LEIFTIALEGNEGLRNIQYLKKGEGTIIVNADSKFPEIEYETIKIDAFSKARKDEFPIQALNVYMLGITLARDPHFPFSLDDIEEAIKQMNAKMAPKNIEVLHQAIEDSRGI